MVVELNPSGDLLSGVGRISKVVQPDTFFLERAKPSLDHAVLLRSVRRDELLVQTVLDASACEPFRGKDLAIVTAQNRALFSFGVDQAKLLQTPHFQRRFGLLGSASLADMKPDNLAGAAVDHRQDPHPSSRTPAA